MTIGCIEYNGATWGTSPDFDPEASCAEVQAEHEADEEEVVVGAWSYTEGECDDDPKAVCVFNEGTGYDVKLHYYNPTPIDEAEEQCLEEDGVFYNLSGDDDDEDDDDEWDDEDERELGTRWVGVMLMDGSFGLGTFEHFTDTGDNCRAVAVMVSISEADPCEDCAFARSFELSEFDYEIDEGDGCPRDELDSVTGLTITAGHGVDTIFVDDDGTEINTLYFLDDE